MMLTYSVKHCRDFCEELKKARQIAEFALKTRSRTSSDVKHLGLKSMIANQILRKYGRNKKAKRITHVNLIIPNQGIVVDKALKLITMPSLKLKLNYYFSGFQKINQIEIDEEYAYITTTRNDADLIDNGKFIGVDLNTTGHVAVVSSPETGKVCKLGKEANHIALKYRAIRRNLQKQGKYRKVKQMKNRQQRLIKNLNHHISSKIVQFAGSTKSGIRLETNEDTPKYENIKVKVIPLLLEQLVILSVAKDDRIQSQVARNNRLLYRPKIHVKNM